MAKKLKSLQRLVLEYPITLIDTSALFCPINRLPEKGDKSHQAQILRSQIIFDSIIFYRRFLESGGRFYITPDILEEYTPGDYVSKKQKKLGERDHLPRKEFELFKTRQRENEGIRGLIKMLEFGENVLQLSDEEQEERDFLKRKYAHFIPREEIGKIDFDFLTSGAAVLRVRRKPLALISNDFGILYSWKDLVRGEKFAPEKFGFFVRIEADIFERANYPSSKKI